MTPPQDAKDIDRAVGGRIRERRISLGLSQQDVAEKMNVLQSSVSKWERGATPLLFRDAIYVAEALGITLHEIWEDQPLTVDDSYKMGMRRGFELSQQAIARVAGIAGGNSLIAEDRA
jgi:transcriptional regulator with XRE-family HTH domain